MQAALSSTLELSNKKKSETILNFDTLNLCFVFRKIKIFVGEKQIGSKYQAITCQNRNVSDKDGFVVCGGYKNRNCGSNKTLQILRITSFIKHDLHISWTLTVKFCCFIGLGCLLTVCSSCLCTQRIIKPVSLQANTDNWLYPRQQGGYLKPALFF